MLNIGKGVIFLKPNSSKLLSDVKELAQNARAGFALRVSMPYGTPDGTEITENDIVLIVRETDLAIRRLAEAIETMAEFIADN